MLGVMSEVTMLSIDLSNYCSKQCPFCYNHSRKEGSVMWRPSEVIAFAEDCVAHGVKAVSLGGGEPFEYEGIFEVVEALYPKCYLTITTNGLPLEDEAVWHRLEACKPDKIHISIHNPEDEAEVARVVNRLSKLHEIGIKPGVNMLVSNKKLEAARRLFSDLERILNRDQIIVIPQRYSCTPTPKELAEVALAKPFQSPSCLLRCRMPSDFVSVSWDKRVSHCSYASQKGVLESLDFAGMMAALDSVEWVNDGCRKGI